MTTSYPSGLDSYTNPTSSDDLGDEVGDRTHSEFHADLNDAMEAVQAELGTDPSGSEATVKARIAAAEASVTAEAALARNADNLTSGTVADARIPSGIARDAEVAAGYQPLDSDLTAIAALSTTAYGRALLELANQAALEALITGKVSDTGDTMTGPLLLPDGTAANPGLGFASDPNTGFYRFDFGGQFIDAVVNGTATLRYNNAVLRALVVLQADVNPSAGTHVGNRDYNDGRYQLLDSDLTAIAALTTTAFGRSLLEAANAAALATLAGVGTGDSPQFTAVNVGHASDTTITRTAAGTIAVEGNEVYRAGGTDVPVADGGTGASDASGARTNLGLVIGTNVHAQSATLNNRVIRVVIDGGGSAITTGAKKVYVTVPYTGTITKARLLADVSGSIVVDVWKDTYANYPPTVADTITASAKPTLSSAVKSEDSTLTGWTTSVTAGDIIEVNVDSASTVTKVMLDLFVTVS